MAPRLNKKFVRDTGPVEAATRPPRPMSTRNRPRTSLFVQDDEESDDDRHTNSSASSFRNMFRGSESRSVADEPRLEDSYEVSSDEVEDPQGRDSVSQVSNDWLIVDPEHLEDAPGDATPRATTIDVGPESDQRGRDDNNDVPEEDVPEEDVPEEDVPEEDIPDVPRSADRSIRQTSVRSIPQRAQFRMPGANMTVDQPCGDSVALPQHRAGAETSATNATNATLGGSRQSSLPGPIAPQTMGTGASNRDASTPARGPGRQREISDDPLVNLRRAATRDRVQAYRARIKAKSSAMAYDRINLFTRLAVETCPLAADTPPVTSEDEQIRDLASLSINDESAPDPSSEEQDIPAETHHSHIIRGAPNLAGIINGDDRDVAAAIVDDSLLDGASTQQSSTAVPATAEQLFDAHTQRFPQDSTAGAAMSGSRLMRQLVASHFGTQPEDVQMSDGNTDDSSNSNDSTALVVRGNRALPTGLDQAVITGGLERAITERIVDTLMYDYDHPLGCSPTAHRTVASAPRTGEPVLPVNIGQLSEIIYGNVPMVLNCESAMKLTANSRHANVNWRQSFQGIMEPDTPPVTLDVELSDDRAATRASFDVDSYLGFASSLAFCKCGLDWKPHPNPKRNIRADLHITGEYQGTQKQLRRIPHFELGRVGGEEGCTVYVMFPHIDMGKTDSSFNILEKDVIARWANEIMFRAIKEVMPEDRLQHLPVSFEHADLLARAPSRETRRKGYTGESEWVQVMQFHFHLHPEYLDLIWRRMEELSKQNGLQHYSEARIFFTAKNLKMRTKINADYTYGLPSALNSTLSTFWKSLNTSFDFGYIIMDRFWADVAREDVPIAANEFRRTPTSHILGLRRCCLQNVAKHLAGPDNYGLGDELPKTSFPIFYEQHLLYDIASMSISPPKMPEDAVGGLMYTQMYASVKELFDAAQNYPFGSDALEELALSSRQHEELKATLKSRTDIGAVEGSYTSSKRRVQTAIMDAQKDGGRNYGVRIEHRVTIDCLIRIFDRCNELAGTRTPVRVDEFILPNGVNHAISFTDHDYLAFVWANINKFCYGFERLRSTTNSGLEASRMMVMFLRNLRFTAQNSALGREAALWRNSRTFEKDNVTKYGLGYEVTMPCYGYAWMLDRIDWESLCFKARYAPHMMFGHRKLLERDGKRLRNAHAAGDGLNNSQRLAALLALWRSYRYQPMIAHEILFGIALTIMQQCRTDVIVALKNDIDPKVYHDALASNEPLTFEYVQRVATERPHTWGAFGRGSALDSHTSFAAWFDCFFVQQNKPGKVKNKWGWYTNPFRTRYQEASMFIAKAQIEDDKAPTYNLRKAVELVIISYFPCMPWANSQGFLPIQKSNDTGKQARIWLKLTAQTRIERGQEVMSVEFQTDAKKGADAPKAAELPEYATMTIEAWESQCKRASDKIAKVRARQRVNERRRRAAGVQTAQQTGVSNQAVLQPQQVVSV